MYCFKFVGVDFFQFVENYFSYDIFFLIFDFVVGYVLYEVVLSQEEDNDGWQNGDVCYCQNFVLWCVFCDVDRYFQCQCDGIFIDVVDVDQWIDKVVY